MVLAAILPGEPITAFVVVAYAAFRLATRLGRGETGSRIIQSSLRVQQP